jgi:hypothetical protein
MKDILFKTKPRLILFGGFVSGFFFFLILALFCLQVSNGKHQIMGYCFAGIFTFSSIVVLYQLFKLQVLKIHKTGIVIEKYLLPKRRNLKLEEIKSIKQSEEKIRFYSGINMFENGFLFYNNKTIITLKDSEKFELISVSEMDFYEFEKLFFKLKRGEGKIKKPIKHFSLFSYLLENGGSILLILFINILNIGLLSEIIKKTVANTVYN